MKQEPWMTEAGHKSGERAERLNKAELAARSPAERFADDIFVPAAWLVLLAGGLLGAVFASEAVRKLAMSYLPDLGVLLMWAVDYGGGFVVGTLIAFLLIDVPTFLGVKVLRLVRPDLFSRRAR